MKALLKIILFFTLTSLPIVSYSQKPHKNNYPNGWWKLSTNNGSSIWYSQKTTIKGESYHLYFKGLTYKDTKADGVREIYLVNDKDKGTGCGFENPGEVESIIYHKLGKGKEFCSVVIFYEDCNSNTNYKQVKISDDVANAIVDLLTGYSKYSRTNSYTGKNHSFVNIAFYTTTSPKIYPTKEDLKKSGYFNYSRGRIWPPK